MNATTPRRTTEGAPPDPWIESREGVLFFLNALLIFPAISVYFPLLLGGLLEGVGVAEGLQEILGIIPEIAARALPFAGPLFLIPLVWALRVRREVSRPGARWGLLGFAFLHGTFVGYALWHWFSAVGGAGG